MIEKWSDGLLSIIVCPHCHSHLEAHGDSKCAHAERRDNEYNKWRYCCGNKRCKLAADGFLFLDGQPVLIDFDSSIIGRDDIVRRGGSSVQPRDVERASLTNKLRRLLFGENDVAKRIASELITDLKSRQERAAVLVVGGGTIGSGAGQLYSDPDVKVISIDVFVSPYTTFVADGHRLPLADHSVEAVWIQAVLEHVLDPGVVVNEIHRVLKPGGLVFADTPFMQQVHEGLYDFTRFTLHGQRWLFRQFKMIDAGLTRGAGSSLNWSILYFVRALTRSRRLGTVFSFAFFWLALMDRVLDKRMSTDAAFGVYFVGRRADHAIAPRDMVSFYDELHALHARRDAGSGSPGSLIRAWH